MDATKKAAELVRKEYPLPEDIAELARLATCDLWHGPMLPSEMEDAEKEAWPGFSTACTKLREWADTNLPREVWFDEGADILLSDLESWPDDEDPDPEPYYMLRWREILAARFPRKLWEYL